VTLPAFDLVRPTTIEAALDALGEEQVAYCGGTELLLAMRAGLHRPAALVDLKRIPELTGTVAENDHLVIGATTIHMDIAADPLVRRHVPMLAHVERAVGNARVRAQGSIGGNLCFAEPKSDVATALIALDATVFLVSPRGEREVAVGDFIAGPYYADKEPDELLANIRIPLRGQDLRAVYLKYQTMERPTLGVALARDVVTGECRLAVGAVGEEPMSWRFDDLADLDPSRIADEVDPTPDLTGSERYKRHITDVYVRRAKVALEEAGER
jgi:carbon-monoxide dehydrogenase medium subunit